MRILFFVPRISGGGAERALSHLANGLVARGHDVIVATITSHNDSYQLDPRVHRLRLLTPGKTANPLSAVAANLRRICAIRATVSRKRPDVVVSFLARTNIRVLIATSFLRIPVIITEHSSPRFCPIGPIWDLLRRFTYQRAARVVSVSRGIDDYFHWLPASKRAVVPNPVAPQQANPSVGSAIQIAEDRRLVVAIGRLVPVKAFDRLIRAFAEVANEHKQWDLAVLGEGPERDRLEAMVQDKRLQGRVYLPGRVLDVYAVLSKADLFCMSSLSEGFPMVLLEAMHCGVAVLSTDCPTGPGEIITNGHDGILIAVNDSASFRKAMHDLMGDSELRSRLAANARVSVRRYYLENVIKLWEQLLSSVSP